MSPSALKLVTCLWGINKMKKLLILFIIGFLSLPLCLFAEDAHAEDTEITDENLAIESKERGPFRIKDRRVEVGLLHGRIGFANNFLSTEQIFKKRMVIDLDDLGDGFKVNFDLGLTPLLFNYFSFDRQWGFGFSINVDTIGMLNLSGNMLTFDKAKNDKSDIGGAAFVDFKASSFFHINKINSKIKANLSVYTPVMYVDPNISYTLDNSDTATKIDINYKVRVYTPTSMEEDASFSFSPTPGIDIQLGAEYPLSEVLGLKEKVSFLDFIVGLDLLNIPLVPSTMKDYMEMSGRIGKGDKIDIENAEDLIEVEDDPVYGSRKKNIYRPFKMLAWANWKPFDVIPVSFIPTIGFAINPMYQEEPGSLEAGIKTRLDLANMLIATIGTGYHDRLWKNSIDFIFNFRFFELNFGLDLRSQDFAKSWSGGGFGVNFGFKFGG